MNIVVWFILFHIFIAALYMIFTIKNEWTYREGMRYIGMVSIYHGYLMENNLYDSDRNKDDYALLDCNRMRNNILHWDIDYFHKDKKRLQEIRETIAALLKTDVKVIKEYLRM